MIVSKYESESKSNTAGEEKISSLVVYTHFNEPVFERQYILLSNEPKRISTMLSLSISIIAGDVLTRPFVT
jgi:hypothetical protein